LIRTTLKKVLNKWESFQWWQKLLFCIPIVVVLLMYVISITFSPSTKKIEKKLLEHTKETTDILIDNLKVKEKKIVDSQLKIKKKQKEKIKEVETNEKKIESIINEIDNSSDNINELLDIHKRINSRK
jgi:maltodextrin utilization protein YvdJ